MYSDQDLYEVDDDSDEDDDVCPHGVGYDEACEECGEDDTEPF